MPRTEKDPHAGDEKAHENVARHAAERSRAHVEQAEDRVEAKAHEKRADGIAAFSQAFEARRLPVEEVAKGFGSLSRDLMTIASKALEQSSQAAQALMQARTVHDAVRAQIDLMSGLMDAQLRYVEAIGRTATQIGDASAHKAPASQATHTTAAKH